MSIKIVSSESDLFLSREQVEAELFESIESCVDISPSTKYQYKRALTRYFYGDDPDNTEVLRDLLDIKDLLAYCSTAPSSQRALLKAAIGKWIDFRKLVLMANAKPEYHSLIQTTMWQLDAVDKAIKVTARKGKKLHTWLSEEQVEKLLTLPPKYSYRGLRDRILLSLLVFTGLRREEAVNAKFEHFGWASIGNGEKRRFLNVYGGKGNKDRFVPVNDRFSNWIDKWHEFCGDGYVLRAMDRQGNLWHESISSQAVYVVVKDYSNLMRVKFLPHDLRRTFAQLELERGTPIGEIQKMLGHDSIKTTETYLNISVNLKRRPLDVGVI